MEKTALPEDVLSIVRQFSSCKTVIKESIILICLKYITL